MPGFPDTLVIFTWAMDSTMKVICKMKFVFLFLITGAVGISPSLAQQSNSVTPGMSMTDFEKLTTSAKYVLFDFYAPWCGPCKKMDPVISQIAEEYKGNVIWELWYSWWLVRPCCSPPSRRKNNALKIYTRDTHEWCSDVMNAWLYL